MVKELLEGRVELGGIGTRGDSDVLREKGVLSWRPDLDGRQCWVEGTLDVSLGQCSCIVPSW